MQRLSQRMVAVLFLLALLALAAVIDCFLIFICELSEKWVVLGTVIWAVLTIRLISFFRRAHPYRREDSSSCHG